mgnify:FL=1
MTDAAPTQTASRWRTRAADLLCAVRGCLPWRLLLLLVLAVLVLHAFGIARLPFPPFTTLGEIYVDSPEVYTRERLVNDRYDQDYWLREQLRLLDAAESADLIAARRTRDLRVSADAGGAAPIAADATADHARRVAPLGLTFEQRFAVLSGIRDRIRQQVLENMLDDRHDLTGNSVYGLKFDTTVIPGRNTRDRAFVSVTLRPDTLFVPAPPPKDAGDAATAGRDGRALGEHLRVFAQRACAAGAAPDRCPTPVPAAEQDRYDKQLGYYDAWRTDIAKRLNLTEDSLFESLYANEPGCPATGNITNAAEAQGRAFYDALTRRTLRAVLGIPEERFSIYNTAAPDTAAGDAHGDGLDASRPIRLPPPWSRYLQISRRPVFLGGDRPCRWRAWFEVQPVFETFAARRLGAAAPPAADDDAPALIPIGETKHGDWQLLVEPWRFRMRQKQLIAPAPLYSPPAALVALVRDQARGTEQPADAGTTRLPPLPSGFFNFVEAMAELDAYTYAIFPKNDVEGQEVSGAVRAGAAASGGLLAFAERLTETRTVPRLVGYGDGEPIPAQGDDGDALAARTVRFGWVVSADGDMKPSLKTQLALVSVPAWTDRLRLSVTTGWLDGSGKPRRQQPPFDLEVTVPPDFSAFDSIFRDDAWVTRGPRMQDDSMEQSIHVIAGQPTRILIPGSRLWRSATVTLGAQRAERIRVLPNMEGIIAEFRAVDLPYAQPGGTDTANPCELESPQLVEMRARPVRLRVWTSEGVDDAKHPVCVIYDPAAQIQRPVRAAAERAAVASGPRGPAASEEPAPAFAPVD